MDGSREYDLCIRQQPKQARMCGVGGTSFCVLFFPFSIFFFFSFFFVAMEWGRSHCLARWQLIDGQSTLRPSFNYASSTKLVKTSRRPHPRRLPHSTINSPHPTHMPNNTPTSPPSLWTLPCSHQPASAPDHSCRTRITLCLPVWPSLTTTPSCTG